MVYVRQPRIRELLLDSLNHFLPALILQIPLLELISFRLRRVPAHGRDVDHALAELDECPPHLRQTLEVTDVAETELGQLLVFLFAEVLDEGVGGQGLAKTKRIQPVLGEAEIEHGCDGQGRGAELFLLFGEV